MTGRFAEYEVAGPAKVTALRRAAVADFAAGLVLAVLAFPFPIVRASVPTLVFVISVLASIGMVHAVYVAATIALLGRTPGMYLFDVGFAPARPRGINLVLFACASVVAFLPQLVVARVGDPAAGLAARAGSVTLSSVKPETSREGGPGGV